MNEQRPMSCAELVELVTEYLEGTLDAGTAGHLERHLPGCAGCVAYVEQLRVTIRLTGTLAGPAVPAGDRERLRAIFRRSG